MTDLATIQQMLASGLAHHQAGRFGPAEQCYQQALSLVPDQPDALHLLGVLCHQTGRIQQSVDLLSRSVSIAATPVSLSNLGQALIDVARFDDAEKCLSRAAQAAPDRGDLFMRLCVARQRQRDFHGAAQAGRRSTELMPQNAEAWSHLATALALLKNDDQALEAANRSIALSPNRAEPYLSLGAVHEQAGRIADAEAAFGRAIAVCETNSLAHRNLAALYDKSGQPAQAIRPLKRALELNPRDVEGWNNLSTLHRKRNEPAAALAAADRALGLAPNHPSAHGNRGLALLALGDYRQGFAEYEWRWRCDNFTTAPRDFGRPAWEGSDPSGRTIFVHAEQGFGDVIQFVRYVPMLAARGARIILECTHPLRALLASVKGVSQVIVSGVRPPEFDLHVPLLSLPRLFDTALETIPTQIPYLSVDEARLTAWKSRIESTGDGFRVGLVWAGNVKPDPARTCPLASLAPLAAIPSLTFYALQRPEDLREPPAPPDQMKLVRFANEIRDFADTAAAMLNLDLILTIDTAAAHLAGALGRPTWTMLPWAADWRWLTDRSDSPWYPTMRLFRQSSPGDWAGVADDVAAALAGRIKPPQSTPVPTPDTPAST